MNNKESMAISDIGRDPSTHYIPNKKRVVVKGKTHISNGVPVGTIHIVSEELAKSWEENPETSPIADDKK